MTDWSADPWFAQHAWVAPRVGETRRSGFKSLRPHSFPLELGEIRPDFDRGSSEVPAAPHLSGVRPNIASSTRHSESHRRARPHGQRTAWVRPIPPPNVRGRLRRPRLFSRAGLALHLSDILL